jgi:hypothetical protein
VGCRDAAGRRPWTPALAVAPEARPNGPRSARRPCSCDPISAPRPAHCALRACGGPRRRPRQAAQLPRGRQAPISGRVPRQLTRARDLDLRRCPARLAWSVSQLARWQANETSPPQRTAKRRRPTVRPHHPNGLSAAERPRDSAAVVVAAKAYMVGVAGQRCTSSVSSVSTGPLFDPGDATITPPSELADAAGACMIATPNHSATDRAIPTRGLRKQPSRVAM